MADAQLLGRRAQHGANAGAPQRNQFSLPALIVEFWLLGLFFSSPLCAQGTAGAEPVRWQAHYTQIYSDNVGTAAPVLGPAFSLEAAGSLTSSAAEVIAGTESIKGSYFGSSTNSQYLQSNPATLSFTQGHTYRITFQYKILTAPGTQFSVIFYSPTAAANNNFLPGLSITGPAGATGTGTLTNTLGPYPDYEAIWSIGSTGAISVDNLQVTDTTSGKVIASENAEGTGVTVGPGLLLQNGASVVTDPTLVIEGSASVELSKYANIATNPAVVPLAGNSTYIIQLDYRIVNAGAPISTTSAGALYASLQPVSTSDITLGVPTTPLFKNAAITGTFSTGAQTASASSWVFNVSAAGDTIVIIDNIRIFRQDAASSSTQPSHWSNLSSLPFPRLGRSFLGPTDVFNRPGMAPYDRTLDQIEKTLALADVIATMPIDTQTQQPDSVRRLRQLNPNAVIIPYRVSEEQTQDLSPPRDAAIGLDYSFWRQVPQSWYVQDSKGNYLTEFDFPNLRFMNISSFSPVVNGQTYAPYLINWLDTAVFPSGIWDGIYFDNLFGHVNPHIPNAFNPPMFDFDFDLSPLPDQTPASTSDMTRAGATGLLQQFRSANGDLQLIMGNAGPIPEAALAPWVNGYLFECFNGDWNGSWLSPPGPSAAGVRTALDIYRLMQATVRAPKINLLEGCGPQYASGQPGAPDYYVTPTPADLQTHRLGMGIALMSDGFYAFDLHGSLTVSTWYDEYTVDSQGNAVQDLTKKGYLGAALTDGVELAGSGQAVFKETFPGTIVPQEFTASPSGAASVSSGALVLTNTQYNQNATTLAYTDPSLWPLNSGATYLLTFNWKVLSTMDSTLRADVYMGSQVIDAYNTTATVTGDSGTAHFPFTVPTAGLWSIRFSFTGGGSIAISSVVVSQGNIGPWRRDFVNGFVLLNPLSQPWTFSSADLAGGLNRTTIHRIKGTQAPDINNGQPVSGSLTLAPFDAIILLADPIPVSAPIITSVSNAAGGQAGVASGAFVSIYGSNFTPLPYDDWSKSIINGQLPQQLDGVNVTIGGKPAYIYAMTPGQINVQAPDVGNGPVQVVVTTGGGASAPLASNSQLYSPAFFSWPGNQPVATHFDYSIAAKNGTFPGAATVPAKPGEVITLWGTGFGPTNPAVAAGQEPQVAAAPTQSPVSVTLGGTSVPVLGAVLSSYAALYQIAIQIPASTPDGDYPVVATVNGAQSPSVILLTVQHAQ